MNKDVVIIRGESVADVAAALAGESEIFIVHDANVAATAEVVASALIRHGQERVKAVIGIETSEERKTMETAVGLCERLLEADASRRALVLAIGGGITTDIAGFSASMYKRGIRYANIPTTLLAQVDAAIGGKTGVNLHGYKNMLGAFHMPEFTFLAPDALAGLSAKEVRCGLAEMLKTFLIGDADAYAAAISLLSSKKKMSGLKDFAVRAAEIKAEIVRRDPLEHGERAVLNLGHTFGHAIEHCSGGQIAHGEAVGMGIILAAKLSEGLGLAEKSLAARLKADFESAGLDVECPFGINELAAAMKKDKKDGKFVLLKGIGNPVVMEVSGDDLCKCTK
ncbi:MAG: 3-dehydroquinate synthase [Bacteroidales bacterium]|nr:3-dehydroquinate synthase [Bacteroidales bacterium]